MSELAAIASFARTDAAGNLIGPDGKVHTQAQKFSPMPSDFGDGEMNDQLNRLLAWQVSSYPHWSGQIYVDGQKYGQPGPDESALRFTTAGGKLELDAGQQPPFVAPPLPLPQEPDIRDRTYRFASPKDGQIKPQILGFGTGVVTCEFEILPNTHGFIRGAEIPGAITCNRDVTGINNGAEVFHQPPGEAGSAPYIAYRTVSDDKPTGIGPDGLNVHAGTLALKTRNELPSGYASADMSWDWAVRQN